MVRKRKKVCFKYGVEIVFLRKDQIKSEIEFFLEVIALVYFIFWCFLLPLSL